MQNEKIIIEASQLFVRYGIKAISMDDIARQVGISKRTLYESFLSKDELLVQCLEYMHNERSQSMTKLLNEAPDIISAFLSFLCHTTHANRQMNPLFVAELCRYHHNAVNAVHKKIEDASRQGLATLLQTGIDQGMIRKEINVNLISEIFMWQLKSAKNADPLLEHFDKEEIFTNIYLNFFRGIATRKGLDRIDELVVEYRNRDNLKFWI